MKSASMTMSLTLAYVIAGAAMAAPTGLKHESDTSHVPVAKPTAWVSTSSWWVAGAGTQIADDPNLTTDWLVLGNEISTQYMFTYMSMDGNMNLVSSLTAENLTFASESVTRGNAGVPKFQDFTINHQVFEALGGFRMELASPSTMTLTRTGFIPAEEAGLFYAMYSGFRDAPIHLLVTDPGFGSTPFELVGEQPTFIEIGLLTTIPAPGTIVAVGAIGLLATVRRRR